MGKRIGKLKGGKGLKGALSRHLLLADLEKNSAVESGKSLKEKRSSKKSSTNGTETQSKGLLPYEKLSNVILVGEGDFSYALSLIEEGYIHAENLVATGFDTEAEVCSKYPHAQDNLDKLKREGVKVYHGVDATKLDKFIHSFKSKSDKASLNFPMKSIDFIVFNFPHTGRGMKDVDRNIRDHQKLILSFFKNCSMLFKIINTSSSLESGSTLDNISTRNKVVITLFEGEPYDSWKIKQLARSEKYRLERSGRLSWTMFPNYNHKRTNSNASTTKPAPERKARTYIFEKLTEN